MKDSLKVKLQDTAIQVMDSLQAQPILKGVLPTAAGIGFSFIEFSIPILRWLGLFIGVAIGCLTLYVKWKEAKSINKKAEDEKSI